MDLLIKPHVFNAKLVVPASKSHTIRRLIMAALTDSVSHIKRPLFSLDTQSCITACRVLGAEISEDYNGEERLTELKVQGQKYGSKDDSKRFIDAGNSGTTLFFAIAAAALLSQPVTFTGDRQIAGRSAGPLLDALADLGVTVSSNNGCVPITVCGPLKGGRVNLPCMTSQYLSALLIAAPLAHEHTIIEIDIPLLNEKPYVEMTLAYQQIQGLYNDAVSDSKIITNADYSYFRIQGGNVYLPINGPVPGDFSSAVFPAAAAVISGGKTILLGLDPNDTQGDKVFFEYLLQMGCEVQWEQRDNDWQVTVFRNKPLQAGVFDLNAAPDLLPIMAVLGAFAVGETKLCNVAHARIKETDRIAVMAKELQKLFTQNTDFCCEEKPDGLIICGIGKDPAMAGFGDIEINLDGRGDHRVVMALACAALGLPAGTTVAISGAEAADATYPGFSELFGALRYIDAT